MTGKECDGHAGAGDLHTRGDHRSAQRKDLSVERFIGPRLTKPPVPLLALKESLLERLAAILKFIQKGEEGVGAPLQERVDEILGRAARVTELSVSFQVISR